MHHGVGLLSCHSTHFWDNYKHGSELSRVHKLGELIIGDEKWPKKNEA